MLPKKNRIPRNTFPAYTKQGFRVFSDLFSGTIYPTTDSQVRVSIVVSKKVAKLAVVRNATKRVFYESIRPYVGDLTSGALIVLYPKQTALNAKFGQIGSEIKSTLVKAKFLK